MRAIAVSGPLQRCRGCELEFWPGPRNVSRPVALPIGARASWAKPWVGLAYDSRPGLCGTWAAPHRAEHYLASDEQDFEKKGADIIALYLNAPARAAVFCVDEMTAIQTIDRLDLVLSLSPARAERHGFEYYRHGTLSLRVAFNTKLGQVLGQAVARHTSAESVAFLTDLVANQPTGKEIHIICDNLPAHKTQAVRDLLTDHRNVRLHYTPSSQSWLNQVEYGSPRSSAR
jgi:hypothetical protein